MQERWIFQHFHKGKARFTERYHHCLTPTQNFNGLVLIPEARFLRKYLGLIEELMQNSFGLSSLVLVVLESAAELMDYRNNSPSIGLRTEGDVPNDSPIDFIQTESAALNERNRIFKLWQEYSPGPTYNGVSFVAFADLAHRSNGEDEFDLFHYDSMSVENRSRCATMRAARLIQASNSGDGKVVVLSEDELLLASNITDDEIQVMSCASLIALLVDGNTNKGITSLEEKKLVNDHWNALRKQCEDNYARRNTKCTATANATDAVLDNYGHFEYYSASLLQKGIHEKKLFKTKLKVTNENPKEAYCLVREGENSSSVYYLNERDGFFNRAIHEDSVVIEPLPESQWQEPWGRRHLVHASTDDNEERNEDNYNEHGENVIPTARVVGIGNDGQMPRRRKYVATMMRQSGATRDDKNILVIPMDMKIPRVRIKTRINHDQLINRRLLIEIDHWEIGSSNPTGHLIKVLGEVGSVDTEVSCLLIENSIDVSPFSANALACLPPVSNGEDWNISREEILKRRDLRSSCRVFSVDPVGCQDIDDAMHARILSNGDIEIGVHIADVTHFLQHESALDKEARRKATTFYLVDRRFDMLPTLLSSDLCSLHGNVDRLAVSVIWTLTPNLKTVKSTWYGRTVIHNAHAMTYEQAHNILHDIDPNGSDPTPPPPLTAGGPVDKASIGALKHDLAILTRFTRILRKRRETIGGAVDLSSGDRGSELKFVLDSDGQPRKVAPKTDLEIHHTIAEMMIHANGFVAETIYSSFQESALLRIHSKVSVENFEELGHLFKASGVEFDGRSNSALAKSLEDAKSKSENTLKTSLFQSLATRAMSEAQYVCTGSLKTGIGLSHYGLGIELYTHFTSPIRRYADVVVHRLLIESLEEQTPVQTTTFALKDPSAALIPESNAISVLQGEGLNDNASSENDSNLDDEEFLDSLIEGAEDLALGAPIDKEEKKEERSTQHDRFGSYSTSEVATICERLNHQNRVAKLSSMQCQRLFLSLYFRENVEITQAIVIDLKKNGLVVYVPKFDMKAPVFLTDRSGNLQIDPVLFGLPGNSGSPPSSGFRYLKTSRMFLDGCCTLYDESDVVDPRLELSIQGSMKKISFSRLDVVTVQVSCDLSDVIARIPPPRLHFVSVGQKHKSSINISTDPPLIEDRKNKKQLEISTEVSSGISNVKTMFDVLSSIEINSDLHNLAPRFMAEKKPTKIKNRVQTIKGRIFFNGFGNNELQNEAVDFEVESNISNSLSLNGQAVMGDYDASRRIEREATSRMQRQAAERRNAKKSKALRRK